MTTSRVSAPTALTTLRSKATCSEQRVTFQQAVVGGVTPDCSSHASARQWHRLLRRHRRRRLRHHHRRHHPRLLRQHLLRQRPLRQYLRRLRLRTSTCSLLRKRLSMLVLSTTTYCTSGLSNPLKSNCRDVCAPIIHTGLTGRNSDF